MNSPHLIIIVISVILIILILIVISLYNANRKNSALAEKNHQLELQQKILLEKSAKLTLAKEKLEEIVEGKDQFLTIISHDLRNPITAIRGFVELLLKQYDTFPDEKKKMFLKEILESVEKLSLLLTNILFWERSETMGIKNHPRMFNLVRRIKTNISLYSTIANDQEIKMHNNIPGDMQVFADEGLFDTLIRNLISNSLKFTEKGGEITFTAEIFHNQVNLKISDTGIGMDNEKIKQILQPLNKTGSLGTHKKKGKGLGLKVVRKIVSLTGGDFSIESNKDRGSTFIVKLPLPETT